MQVCIDQIWDEKEGFDGYFRVRLPTTLRQRMEALGRDVPNLKKFSLLGAGTYGQVYSMRIAETPVAVKIFHEMVQDQQGKLHRIPSSLDRMEIGHVRDLLMSEICGKFRQCVPFLASALCLETQAPAIVMPRYQTDLARVIQTQGVDAMQRHSLMKDLLTAMVDLHAQGFMHRDVKPNNCFLDTQGRLFLGDFNLTRTTATDRTYTLTGFEEPLTPITQTLVYRAPEIALQARRYTTAIDCWSVGLVWLELLKHDLVLTGVHEPMDTWGLLYVMLRVFGPPGPTALVALRELGVSRWRLKELMRQAFHLSDNGYPMAYEFETILKRCCCLAEAQVLCGLLDWNPATRWTAAQALQSAYFTTSPGTSREATGMSLGGGGPTAPTVGTTTTTGGDPPLPSGPPAAFSVPGLNTSAFHLAAGVVAAGYGANPGAKSRETLGQTHPRPLHPLLRAPPASACCAAHHHPLELGKWNRSLPVDVVTFWPYRVPAPLSVTEPAKAAAAAVAVAPPSSVGEAVAMEVDESDASSSSSSSCPD